MTRVATLLRRLGHEFTRGLPHMAAWSWYMPDWRWLTQPIEQEREPADQPPPGHPDRLVPDDPHWHRRWIR